MEDIDKHFKCLRVQAESEPIDIEKIIRGQAKLAFMSKPVIKELQTEDEELMRVKFYLTSGNRALMRDNKCPQVKKYISSGAKVEDDGLLVVEKAVPHSIVKIKVPVIPRNIARGILHSTHIKLDHPPCSQNKKAMDRYCFSLDQNKTIDDICKNCHLCNSLLKLPVEIPNFSPSDPPEHPGTHWTADVMKYGKKNILVATDNLSSFTVASISGGERAEQLEEAITLAILPFKSKATDVIVRVDTAPGLAKLKKTDKLLKDGIKLDPGHVKNPNSCAKVDKIMSELRRELKVLSPEESGLSHSNLARAIANLNSRTRHLGLSSREIIFQRDQQTDENITLSDSSLQMKASEIRDKNRQYSAKSQANAQSKPSMPIQAKVGSLVHIKEEKDKGSARELYIVVKDTEPNHLRIKKLLHSLGNNQMSLRQKEYTIGRDKVYFAPNQPSGPPPIPPFTLRPVNPPELLRKKTLAKKVKLMKTRYIPLPIDVGSDDDNIDIHEPRDEDDFGILDLSSLSLTSDLGSSLTAARDTDEDDDLGLDAFRARIEAEQTNDENNESSEKTSQQNEAEASLIDNSEHFVKEEVVDNIDEETIQTVSNDGEISEASDNIVSDVDDDVHMEELFENEANPEDIEIENDDKSVDVEEKSDEEVVSVEDENIDETVPLPRRSTRHNKGKTSKFEDFEQDIEQFLDSGRADPPFKSTPANSDVERSLDWDNYASDPSFQSRGSVIVERRITRSFNVDDLEISSDTTSSSVCDLQPVQHLQPEADLPVVPERNLNGGDDDENDVNESDDNDDVPPMLPPRRRRSFSVMVCTSSTCKPKPKQSKDDGFETT